MYRSISKLAVFLLLLSTTTQYRASGAPPALRIVPQGSELVLSWTASSVTVSPPYLHYDFQLQQSSNLVDWSSAAPRIAGATLTGSSQVLSNRLQMGTGPMFFRLLRWFDRPGADLSGLDLRGADLHGANLAGVNLSGAQLAGAQMLGANIHGVDLGALSTAGVDLSGTIGTPVFRQVHGAPSALVSDLLPRLPRSPSEDEFSRTNTVIPGIGIARQLAVVGLEAGATVSQMNTLLANHGASIVSSLPRGPAVGIASVLVRFNTANAAELNELTKALEGDPAVGFAMPDIEIHPDVVTDDSTLAAGWEWDRPPTRTGGNWGLEHARVPQMWNYGETIIKAGRDSVPTLVIDFGFPSHTDIGMNVLNPGVAGKDPAHGIHVAGIVAASYGNGQGIDGVNPFAKLRVHTIPANSTWSEHDTVVSALRLAPDTRVVNMSWGFRWTVDGTKVLTQKELLEAWRWATNSGVQCLAVATNNPGCLFVCSAGNDYRGVPANVNSGWTAAQLVFGAPNVLVVQALQQGGAIAPLSNVPGTIGAPGEDILSLAPGNAYVVESGTSMASPFVTGLAGFLWAAEPNLTVSQMMSVLRPFGPGSSVDAYESLLKINDFHPGTPILKGLFDIDDGTPDGATRVTVPSISQLGDRNFLRISGADFKDLDSDGDGGLGDGKVDMADFRMWRDWLLYGEEAVNLNYSLNGSDQNPKFDANQDGKREPEREIKLYPRGDFNGDGVMNRTNSHLFKGVPLTDLEVLMTSGLWEDPLVDVGDLPDLLDTVDLIVSAESLFLKEPGFPEGTVHLIDSATGSKLDSMFNQPLTLTRAEPVRILTVPVGKTYFISSDPILRPTSERLLMRAVDKLAFGTVDRGGDFAVDLTAAEMTARFTTKDPDAFRVDSNPQARAVVALLDKALTADPVNPPQAYADDQANVYAWAKNFADQDAPKDRQTLYTAQVKWQRAFSKLPNVADPKFHVKPIRLRLSDHDDATNELSALATILIERRVGPATNADWQPLFYSSTKIVGRGDPGNGANTFRIDEHSGAFPEPQPIFEDTTTLGRVGMTVEFLDYFGRVPLSDITNGASFELRYTLKAEVLGPLNINNPCDGLCLAEAYVGDPLNYGSGVSMRYGDFGSLFEFQGFTFGQGGDVFIPYSSGPDFYFVLFQTNNVSRTESPVALQMGVVGNGMFVVTNPPAGITIADFRLLPVPVARPVDVDQDGIDDLYEYQRPTILNPLIATDAGQDPDLDGLTNLAEYQNGTDPLVKNQPPVQYSGLYPGLGTPSAVGNLLRVGDINVDGVNDLVYLGGTNGGLVVELGNPGGTFQRPMEMPITWPVSFSSDIAIANLDSDTIPDLVITAQVNNKAYIFKGTGDGRFQPMVDLATGSKPRQVLALKLNSDSILDLAILNETAKTINLFQNHGNATFTAWTNIPLIFGSALGLAGADMNGDGITDLVASANSDVVAVLLSNGNGTFQPLRQFQVGLFPDYVAVGDLDGDGRPDIATTSPNRKTLSVLYNEGGGTNFAPAQILNLAIQPLGIIAKDLDGDGRASLIIGDRTPVTTVLHGKANRALDSISYLAVNSGFVPALADFNGDGVLDLLNLGGSLQSIHSGLTNGTFDAGIACVETNRDLSHFVEHTVPSGAPPRWLALENQAESLLVLQLSSPGSCQTLQTLNVGQYVQWLSMGDVSGDGIPDALVASYSSAFGVRTNGTNQVTIYRGDASGAFGNPSYLRLPEPPVQVHAAELNGDARKDLLLLTREPYQMVVYLQDTNGGWLRQTAVPMFASTLLVADLNSDGIDEVLIGQPGEDTAIYGWNGTALSPSKTLPNTKDANAWSLVDYDGDNDLDLLMSRFGTGGPSIVLSLGQGGTLGTPQTLLSGVSGGAFHVADVTGDGRKDLLVDDLESAVTIYAAKSDGTFEAPQTYIHQRFVSSTFEAGRLFLKDLTGDGRLELIRTGGPGFSTLVHR